MNRTLFILLLGALCMNSFAAEQQLWTDNKMTPDQPFPARVRAVLQSWGGYDLLLEEIGGERLCFAHVQMSAPLSYTLVTDPKQELADEPKRKAAHWNYISPGIEINRFSWSIGPHYIGRIFGADDVLLKVSPGKDPTK